jgi:SAM-dependent methyltransferase
MSEAFSDHFASVATHYADSRPTYPPALFEWLASQCIAHDLAWDCGAGNGQASMELAKHFNRVIATDGSAAQIARAIKHPRIEYRVAVAEDSGLDELCADLIVVAQALHWFNLTRFYVETGRILKPGGVIAAWSYGMPKVEGDKVDAIVQQFYFDEVGSCWPPERRHVESGYRDLPFPFRRITPPTFAMSLRWSLDQLLGYLRSWSATAQFIKINGFDPVTRVEQGLRKSWGDVNQLRKVDWPLAMLVGQRDLT